MYTRLAPAAGPSPVTQAARDGIVLHERLTDLPTLSLGPFARRPDGAIVAVEGTDVITSRDQGQTWERRAIFTPADQFSIRPERAILCTRHGALVVGCINDKDKQWTWTDAAHDAPGARAPTYAMRSLDGGQTWLDRQMLHEDWSGCIRNLIETRDGRIVLTAMRLRHAPGRHTVLTYASPDEGKTWQASNLIDLGDMGHHGGATEGTIVELKDGRLLQYIRTNFSQLWFAISQDGGRYWHPMGPAGIDASSAPAQLLRLASGRIALCWNRLYPEGKTSYPYRGGDGLWSAVPVSNHREELSLAFSEDEGEHWSAPVVVARKADKWLSYPYLFEVEPGVLWLTTMQGDLRARLREADFVK